LLRLVVTGFVISVGIGVVAGLTFHALGYVRSPFLLAVALSATSLGLVLPILKDAGQLEADLGQLTVAGASVADLGAMLLLSFFFSWWLTTFRQPWLSRRRFVTGRTTRHAGMLVRCQILPGRSGSTSRAVSRSSCASPRPGG
jgi:hypothetical protein